MTTFDLAELRRILAIVRIDGDGALAEDDRATYNAWREATSKLGESLREVAWVVDVFDKLPANVRESFQDWTLEQLAVVWPMLKEDLASRGVDVEAAEKRGDDAS